MRKTVAEACPKLVREWSIRNAPLSAKDVTIGSHKKIWWTGSCGHEWQAIVKNRVKGSGCPFCSGNQLLKGYNDLASKHPELVPEWSERNLPLQADMVQSASNQIVFWRCSHGHEWRAKIADRSAGSGCPYCAGHKLMHGFNDLESQYPELAAEWSERNLPKLPGEVYPKSRQNVWWKCRVCGHEWQAVVNTRVRGSSCPICAGRQVAAGLNDLATTDPELMSEWDYARNTAADPSRISRESGLSVWWKCPRGHHWKDVIAARAIERKPCRICRRAFLKEYPDWLLRYCAEREGHPVLADHEDLIGIPISNYFPEDKAAIEISRPSFNSKEGYRWEYVKTQLCRKAGIHLIRIRKKTDRRFEDCSSVIMKDDSKPALVEAIRDALQLLDIWIPEERLPDKEELYRQYLMS